MSNMNNLNEKLWIEAKKQGSAYLWGKAKNALSEFYVDICSGRRTLC